VRTSHRTLLLLGLALALGVLTRPRVAAAYPQLVSADNPRCTSCHLSPAGGNLLNENGLAIAESQSQFGTDPAFFYDKVPTPDWLTPGGAVRARGGFVSTPENGPAGFPIQSGVFAPARTGTWGLFEVPPTGRRFYYYKPHSAPRRENEMAHTVPHREDFTQTYERLKGVTPPAPVLMWAEGIDLP